MEEHSVQFSCSVMYDSLWPHALGLKMIIFCTWKLGVGMSKAIIWIPDIPIRCPVPSGSPTNNQLQVPVPSCAAWGKVSDFSEPWLPHRKNGEKRVREIRIGNWQGCYEEGWAPKNWCFWTMVLEKTLESPLDFKEIQPVHSEGDQPWDFFGRNDAEAETPVLWPPHVKHWLIGKDSDAGRDWGQEEKGYGVAKSQIRLSNFTFTFHFSLSCIGEGNGNPLQCSCLENPQDGGAWWAAVHGVTKSRTRLSNFTFTFHFSLSCIGEGNGNPLQCSCLENPRDGGAW